MEVREIENELKVIKREKEGWGKETKKGEKTAPVHKNSKYLCRYSSLNEVVHNSPVLKCGLPKVITPKEYVMKMGKSNFSLEKPDKHHLSQMITISINSDKARC